MLRLEYINVTATCKSNDAIDSGTNCVVERLSGTVLGENLMAD